MSKAHITCFNDKSQYNVC